MAEDTDLSLYPSEGRDASLMAGRIYFRKVRLIFLLTLSACPVSLCETVGKHYKAAHLHVAVVKDCSVTNCSSCITFLAVEEESGVQLFHFFF